MTQSFSGLVYVPVLHRELVSETLLEGVRDSFQTVWPGLPRPRGAFCEELWLTPDFFYTPAQAAACLEDFRHLDAESLSLAAESDTAHGLKTDEREALSHFARTGGALKEPLRDGAARKAWAQRFLLLGWIQEERVLEMDTLAERYQTGVKRLMAHLGEGNSDDAGISAENMAGLLPSMHELFPEDPATLLPSWRFMLELLSIVVPEEMILCSADTRMCTDLRAAGLCSDAPSAEVIAGLPPAWHEIDIVRRLRWQTASVRELLGVPATPEKPWLDMKRNLLIFVSEKE